MNSDANKIARLGLAIIVVGFLGLGGWVAMAPLQGAVVVSGLVKVGGYRKVVQHNEGGIVRQILVQDGMQVARGQPLILLDDPSVAAGYGVLRSALDGELARQARLHAEAIEQARIEFPAELMRRVGDRTVRQMVDREQALFSTRRDALHEQVRLLHDQITQTEEEMAALADQRQSEAAARGLADRELQVYQSLRDQKFVSETRLLSQKRMVAEYQSRTEERQAEMARAAQKVQDLKLRISSLRSEYVRAASEGLKESAVRIVELRERLQPSEDALRRQSIVAPVAGKVIGLRIHTEGGTIAAREPLMEIVPESEALVIEAQASVDAIKELHVGQEADIRFTALPYRTTPLVMGKLAYISPDALADEQGRPFYQLHVAPDPKSLQDAQIDSLNPGMAAEVYIKTQSRTAFEYLMKPITDSLLRAFRER